MTITPAYGDEGNVNLAVISFIHHDHHHWYKSPRGRMASEYFIIHRSLIRLFQTIVSNYHLSHISVAPPLCPFHYSHHHEISVNQFN